MSGSTNTNANNFNPFEQIQQARKTQADYFAEQSIRTAKELLQVVDGDTVRISDDLLMQYYLPGLISDDNDESEYYRKKLGEYVGGIYRPFYVYSAKTGEDLFYVHGCAVRIGTTNLADRDVGDQSISTLMKIEFANPLSRMQGVQEEFSNVTQDLAQDSMDSENNIRMFYYGWYEVFDYFGILPPEDEVIYAPIRQKRDKLGFHIYWMNKKPLSQYIQEHGTYTQQKEIKPVQEAHEPEKQDVKPEHVNRNIEIDTSDWD